MAMIEAGLVDLEQVFFPCAQDATGRTFQELRERKCQPWSNNSEPDAGQNFRAARQTKNMKRHWQMNEINFLTNPGPSRKRRRRRISVRTRIAN